MTVFMPVECHGVQLMPMGTLQMWKTIAVLLLLLWPSHTSLCFALSRSSALTCTQPVATLHIENDDSALLIANSTLVCDTAALIAIFSMVCINFGINKFIRIMSCIHIYATYMWIYDII